MKIKSLLKKILPLSIMRVYYFFMKIAHGWRRNAVERLYPSCDSVIATLDGLTTKNIKEIKNRIIKCIGCKRFVNQLVLLYVLRNEKNSAYEEAYRSFVSKVSALDSKSRPYEKWQCLKVVCLGLGFFRLANEFRKKANANLLSKRCVSKRYAIPLFNVLMEIGNIEQAGTVLDNALRYASDYEKSLLLDFFSLYTEKKIETKQAVDFYQTYIADNQVVILGPVSDLPSIKEKIGENAVVIRNNYFGNTPDEEILKTDVSYYNTGRFEQLQKKHFFESTHECKFYCLKNPNAIDKVGEYVKKQCHIEPQIYCLFNYSSPYMLPIMLIDLILNNAKLIEVYGNTLYLSEKVHGENYISKDTEFNNIDYWLAFADHGIIDNFLFLQNLYKAGVFNTDCYFSSVLNMDVEEYLEKMEQRWVFA